MSPTVLIISSSPDDSLLFGLQEGRVTLLLVNDASSAIDHLRRGTPNAIFLDLDDHAVGGCALLRGIKKEFPLLPVIVFSATRKIETIVEAFQTGAWDCVFTPIQCRETLNNTLQNCLEQSRLRATVRESREQLFRLVQNLPVIIFILNRTWRFEFLNHSTTHILGYTPQEIFHAPRFFLRRIPASDRKIFLRTLRTSFQVKAQPFRLQFRFLHKNGYHVFLQAQSLATEQSSSSPPSLLEGMITDITRHSYLDDVLRQNERLSMVRTMTQEVAHEIRNPLVALGGCARKLRVTYPDSEETEIILAECQRLERLMRRITTYVRPAAPRLQPCSISAAVSFVLRLISDRLDRFGLSCQAFLPQELPPVLADQDSLHRIFFYLMLQAVDLVHAQGQLTIIADQSNDVVHVTLAMEPIDITLPDSNQLLMPFSEDGQGLNLASCYQLLEAMHGRLTVEQYEDMAVVRMSIPKYRHRLPLPPFSL